VPAAHRPSLTAHRKYQLRSRQAGPSFVVRRIGVHVGRGEEPPRDLSADHLLPRRGVRMLNHPFEVGALGQKLLRILAIHPLSQRQDDGAGRAQ